MRLIVTRPLEDAGPLARRLAALGHEAIIAPLLEIVPYTDYSIPRRDWQAIAITSANGARALKAGHGLDAVPVFTVGAQSKAASLAAGFKTVTAAGGDVIRLAAHLANILNPALGPVLYLSGAETAGDLERRLEAAGFETHRLFLYEAVAARALPESVDDGADAVLLYSPRTARIWASLAAAHPPLEILVHYCLSANVAEALPPAYMTRIAPEPTDDGLLALLHEGP